jgi:hypothetical protein
LMTFQLAILILQGPKTARFCAELPPDQRNGRPSRCKHRSGPGRSTRALNSGCSSIKMGKLLTRRNSRRAQSKTYMGNPGLKVAKLLSLFEANVPEIEPVVIVTGMTA